MLELTIVTIFVSIMFVFAIWYASYRTKQRSKIFKSQNQQFDYLPEEPEHEFGSILQDQLSTTANPQSENIETLALESEPNVTLSESALTNRARETRQISADDETNGEIDIASEMPLQTIDATVDNAEQTILTLTVMAKAGQDFDGEAVLTLLTNHAFQYGDMAIFHRYAEHNRHVLYSVADVINPGTLDVDLLANRRVKGLVFFMSLPLVDNGLRVFDDMLNTARTIADKLSGELCDGQRRPMKEATIELLRSQIFNFDINQTTHSDHF